MIITVNRANILETSMVGTESFSPIESFIFFPSPVIIILYLNLNALNEFRDRYILNENERFLILSMSYEPDFRKV